ncbi:MAG: family 20 glycosylhydrolase [Lentisphaeria bacterium]|nr:family 20 glycosylhydrolase [Lentisphaeria bacterium]
MIKENLLHVDFKGVLPDFDRALAFPEFWKNCGFSGVILEFDAKYPWRTWPGVKRGNFTRTQFRKFISRCQELGLETIPLIQVHGHLEWLLDSPRYAKFRECDFVNEICPHAPGIRKKMKKWIDEVAELFAGSSRIHLGGDEAWHAGSCPVCRQIGKRRIYAEYFSEMSNYALSRGLIPMIWGDFFAREKATDMLDDFPEELQLINWNYNADCTFENALDLMQGDHKVLGASGIGVSGDAGALLWSPLNRRLENISRWLDFAEKHHIGVIHTIWGRDTSLGRPYANWYAAVAGCIAAGNPEKWESHAWKEVLIRASKAVEENQIGKLSGAAAEVLQLPADNEIERAALEYYALAMRFQQLRLEICQQGFVRRWQEKARKHIGLDEYSYAATCRYFYKLAGELAGWKKDFTGFSRKNRLSDFAEVLDMNYALVKEDLEQEMKTIKARGF